MAEDRREFLKLASVAALLAGGAFELLDPGADASEEEAPKGIRLAMVIDLRRCVEKEGCVACTQACHRLHNVPAMPEKRHEVKWVWKEPFAGAFPDLEVTAASQPITRKPVPVLCNHCDAPPCAKVCPTEATWKRPDGIVMMDWHRCIGCRYCIAACPFGSRSFNWLDPRPHVAELNRAYPTRTRGVVEKCTFCEERLARKEPPACVAACPPKAMLLGDVNDPGSEVRRLLNSRFALRRKAALGTHPEVFYLV